MTTPNMGLTKPTVSSTPGPDYAEDVNDDLDLVDAHDHTTGKGPLVPVAGLNINADLPLAGHALTGAEYVGMQSQSVAPVATGATYSRDGELHYIDGAGNDVPITLDGQLDASSIGGFTGLTSPASASYNAGTGTFKLQQNTNEAGALDAGPVVIRDTAANAKGITQKSPTGLAADLALTLPGALPAGPAFMTMDASGVEGTQIRAGGITESDRAAYTTTPSSSSGAFFTSSTDYVDVTNLSASITTHGRPVMIALVPGDASVGGQSYIFVDTISGSGGNGFFKWVITGGVSTEIDGGAISTDATGSAISSPVGVLSRLWIADAGTYTIKLMAATNDGFTVHVMYAKLVLVEF